MTKNNRFDSVIFDVDSTLTTIEGLDFLAQLKGKGPEMIKITKAAMEGNMSMRQAMDTKMNVIAPTYDDLLLMGKEYVKKVTPGARETINILKKNNLDIWIITGNFQPGVGILGKYLKIDPKNIITNQVFHDNMGNYKGYDTENPLSNNKGKVVMIEKYKKQMKRTVFIGDGSTDLEAKNSVDLFIGFGGVVERQNVKEFSDIYVSDKNLMAIIPHIIMQ